MTKKEIRAAYKEVAYELQNIMLNEKLRSYEEGQSNAMLQDVYKLYQKMREIYIKI